MTRRSAMLAALGTLLAGFVIPSGQANAGTKADLRIDLSQWDGITFEYQGQRYTISGAEMFRIIKGGK